MRADAFRPGSAETEQLLRILRELRVRQSELELRDISEHKRIDAELGRAHDELELRVAERTTELARAVAQVRKNKERLYFALETCHTGAWDLNLDERTSFRSPEHDRIFGYQEQLPQWSYALFLDHVLPEDRETVNRKFQRSLENRSDWNFECRIRRADGLIRWIRVAGRHRQEPENSAHHIMGIVQDITIRKQIEEEILRLNRELEQRVVERTADLAKANELLQLANEEWLNTFNASTDPIMILDCSGRIRRANSAMAALCGMRIEECVGRCCYDLVHHADAPFPLCPHFQMLQDGLAHTEEIFEPNLGRHLLVTVSPLHDAEGNLTGSMHYIKDITSLKEAEQVLANAKNELESRVAERTSALAKANEKMRRVSFELVWAEEKERERIAGELHDQVGQTLLLAKMKLDALADAIPLDSLRSSAQQASALVESSIQDIRSLTFRMRPPLLDTAGIKIALEWLCSSISSDYHLQVDFVCNCQPDSLSTELRYSLYQAVRELLLNVVKHAGTDQARLLLSNENNTLVVRVVDQGSGLRHPEAILNYVNKGSYGLYHVQQRIEHMGGTFAVESAPGRGTSITVTVPYCEE